MNRTALSGRAPSNWLENLPSCKEINLLWRWSYHPAPVIFSASSFAFPHSNQTPSYSPTKFATMPSLVYKIFTPSIKLPPHCLAKLSFSSLLRYHNLQETFPVPHPALGRPFLKCSNRIFCFNHMSPLCYHCPKICLSVFLTELSAPWRQGLCLSWSPVYLKHIFGTQSICWVNALID